MNNPPPNFAHMIKAMSTLRYRCPHCHRDYDANAIATVNHPISNRQVWLGCYGCLAEKQAQATSGKVRVDLAMYALLGRCKAAITQPLDWRETDALVEAINAAMKG